MLTEQEYKAQWLQGLHQTDYNACRFADDKIQFAKNWIYQRHTEYNIDNPTNIVERINNYKLYDLDYRKSIWADKISCLNELRIMGLSDIIIEPIFFTRSIFTKDMFDSLPDCKMIFKCNHGSGWNMKFEKKPGCNPDYLISKLNEWYSLNYAYIGGWEWHYDKIIPGIIVQPDICGDLITLLDWSFWCENGEIQFVNLSRKFGKNLEECLLTCNENGTTPDYIVGMEPLLTKANKIQLDIIEQMKPIVKKLAQNFKFVRVDLFYVNNKIYFSEMTFTPCSGNLNISFNP